MKMGELISEGRQVLMKCLISFAILMVFSEKSYSRMETKLSDERQELKLCMAIFKKFEIHVL